MYYYSDGENEVGPFSLNKLQTLKDKGMIADGTLVRDPDTGLWVPFSQITTVTTSKFFEDFASSNNSISKLQDDSIIKNDIYFGDLAIAPTGARDQSELTQLVGDGRIGAATPSVSASGWLAHPATPWRRYGARLLDTTFNGTIGFFLLGLAFYTIAPATADSFFSAFDAPAGRIFDFMLTTAMASLIGGALIGTTGFTLGKLIFGVKITRLNGGKLGILSGLSRDFSVFLKGMGLGIPIVALVTMLVANKRLNDYGSTTWDEGKYIVWHRPSGTAQYLLNVIGIILIFVVIGLARAISSL